MKKQRGTIDFSGTEKAIVTVKGQNVIIDSDVADLRRGNKGSKSTTPPQADGVCCSFKVFDLGSVPLVPPQGAGVWTLRNESSGQE
jgi:hypothetical protein